MKVKVVGTAQDGGVPHLGCTCDTCEEAREDSSKIRYNASLLLKAEEDDSAVRYLIDPTPDVRYQITGQYLDGVFVSHGELGHITGLLHFGEEGMDAEMLPVHVTDKTAEYIKRNDPFRLLVDRNNIDLREFNDGKTMKIQGGRIEAREAQHKGVNTDTLSFMIEGEEKMLYYMSDINAWDAETLESIREADIAVIDGTFWNEEEIDRYQEVPHPVMKETMAKTDDWDTRIIFTHINHTNPALRPDSQEREELEERGFEIAQRGMEFQI